MSGQRSTCRGAVPSALLSFFLAACAACTRGDEAAVDGAGASVVVDATGAAARELLANPGFAWTLVESPHARIHVERGSKTHAIVGELADSIEVARAVALETLGEADMPNEPKLELFLLDTREDMRRLVGRPIGGFAQPGELTAGFVAGPGYRPFFRHELTHAYAAVRWGPLTAGDWLTEGLAALGQGPCQGHSVDELAAGHLSAGEIPPLSDLRARFRELPELPSYMTAASVVGFVSREHGIAAVRALWRGAGSTAQRNRTSTPAHPLGAGGEEVEARWREHLRTIAPARLDSVRLRSDGC